MQPSRPLPSFVPWTLLILSLIGFADAAYLSAKHYLGETPTCILFSGCDVVTTSKYATIGPVSVALLGALFYFAVLVLVIWYLDKRNTKAIKNLAFLSVPGFLFTLYLLYLQGFVLDAWCIYCLASSVSSTAIFLISQYAWHTIRTGEKAIPTH